MPDDPLEGEAREEQVDDAMLMRGVTPEGF